MKSLFLKFAFIFFMSPALATDYYAALWKAEAPAISTGRNSDDNTFVGYNTGDWPSVGNVTTIENLEELMTVMEGDAFGPHTLYLWHGTFDDAGDFLRLDDLNTQSLTVVGQGDTTILDGSKFSGTSAVSVNGRSGMTFRNFKISGGVEAFRLNDAGFSEYAKNPTGNTIDSVTMENQSEYGVRLSCAQDSYTDFTLKNSVITDNNQDVEGVRFITHSDCSINAIKILDNTWTGLEVGIHFFSLEQNAGFNNASPYDVLIEGNRIIDTYGYGIVFQSGLKSGTGTTSYVRNNYLEDIGKTNSPNVNGIQLSWCHDLIVEKNTINKVTTSKPDGHGIIADWAWRDNNYLSDGVIIRENTIYGLDSLNCDFALSAGINVYKAKNTIVHHNVSYNNCVGFKLTRPESTGTLFYNNTAYGNIRSSVRVDLSAPASVWKNNIFDGGGITPYGVLKVNTGTVFPTMSNNIFYNHTTAEKYDWVVSEPVSLGVGSRIIDPQLISNYELAENSPAIDAADESVLSDLTEAVSINGVVIKTSSGESFPQGGGKLDIGAYEYIAAAAALESRMGGLAVYDTDLDITRVADANLAASNTFGLPAGTSLGIHPSDWSTFPVQGKILANGTMTWSGAMFWIDAMNATYYLGVNNWYLPGTLQPDPSCSDSNQFGSFGSGCTGSPMGHLFYDELSGTAGEWVGTSGDPDLTLFSNFQTNYWSSAQYPSPSMVPPNNAVYGSAWAFNFANGSVNGISKNQAISAWAVTDGDVLPVLLRCDLNNNGEVDAGDLSQVLRMVLDNIADDLDCDINNGGFGDGVISTSDLVIVTRIVLGIIPAIYN